MQRQMLRLTLILGVMVTLLGGTGVFAVFTDEANGGPNSVTTGALAKAADLQIAGGTAIQGAIGCQGYAENTQTAQYTLTGLTPESAIQRSYVCLKNNGSSPLDLRLQAAAVRDLDVDCTGDEAVTGDATCGNNGVGELSFVVSIDAHEVNCQTLVRTGGLAQTLDRWGTAATAFGASQLSAGGVACIEFELRYSQAATATQQQLAQSDSSTWNFRFEGTAS